jgi:c-di-GMP-binding flagellar brake protein YcgR
MENGMRLDFGPEKTAENRFDGDAGKRNRAVEDCEVINIPFRIDDEIMVRSLSNAAHRTKSRIVGAAYGKFILIQEPIVVINHRFLAIFDDVFECSYFADGYRYIFLSRYRSHVLNDVVCIEYPGMVDVNQIRKHRRIKVNIETKYAALGTPNWFTGDMVDISKGGCRLVLKPKETVAKGMRVLLVFSLPNEDEVNDLRAVVVRSNPVGSSETTEVGLSFTGPPHELAKISNFCEFCLFFDVE